MICGKNVLLTRWSIFLNCRFKFIVFASSLIFWRDFDFSISIPISYICFHSFCFLSFGFSFLSYSIDRVYKISELSFAIWSECFRSVDIRSGETLTKVLEVLSYLNLYSLPFLKPLGSCLLPLRLLYSFMLYSVRPENDCRLF